MRLNPDFNCWSNFVLSWVDKIANGTKDIVSGISKVDARSTSQMIQLVDQVRIRLVAQWIKDISRTEMRLNQAKYYPNSVLRLICYENMQTNKYNNDFGFSVCKECTDSLNYVVF